MKIFRTYVLFTGFTKVDKTSVIYSCFVRLTNIHKKYNSSFVLNFKLIKVGFIKSRILTEC